MSYIEALDARLRHVSTALPKVSIVVTNYNYSRYLRDCLGSVSAQNYPEIECVVVDDASVDDSVREAESFIESNRSPVSFKLIQHESTRGQYAGFRTGFNATDGAFVSFLDADDLLLPDFVSEHVSVHLSRPPVAFTSSNQYQIDSQGQLIGGLHPDLLTQAKYRITDTVSLHRAFWIWATTSSMMFRRAVLSYVLSKSEDVFRKCADNYVCHFCNLLGGSILIPDVLGCFRRHQQNTFSTNPLIGGRLPTGDMRNHPDHELVTHHIRQRLFERRQEFIALLGAERFLHAVAKVTPLADAWRNRSVVRLEAGGKSYRVFLRLLLWVYLRRAARAFRHRHPSVSIGDLENVEPTPGCPES